MAHARGKSDWQAQEIWEPEIYATIPKSVFAMIAWHLANITSEAVDEPGEAEKRFLEEWDILQQGRHLPQIPTRKVRNHLTRRR